MRRCDVLVTGGAGFIGSHLCGRLVEEGADVVAVDNFDPFYDPSVKWAGVEPLLRSPHFRLVQADVCDAAVTEARLAAAGVGAAGAVVHLAALAGVRPSVEQPVRYAHVNLVGTAAVLELSRKLGCERFVFGSSSSVYGNTPRIPFSEDDPAAAPISPYAATKRAGELLCHADHHLYGTSVICLRFFTVYGPRQRPDLAIHRFARLMAAGLPLQVFGDGSAQRDYTYVDDILDGIHAALRHTAAAPGRFDVVNLGGSRTTSVLRLIDLLGSALGMTPRVELRAAQPGDVDLTFASLDRAEALLGYHPRVPIEEGIRRFADWFLDQERRAAREGQGVVAQQVPCPKLQRTGADISTEAARDPRPAPLRARRPIP